MNVTTALPRLIPIAQVAPGQLVCTNPPLLDKERSYAIVLDDATLPDGVQKSEGMLGVVDPVNGVFRWVKAEHKVRLLNADIVVSG